jgi:predicted alpha/beta-fold hydrolase
MNTDLKDALLKYVREVPAGCVKTYNEVCECIDNLVHRRFTDSDMLSAVTTAIDNNYPELCRKDFEKEEKLKKQFRTIQEFVDLATEERHRLCRQSRRIQDDPKFAGMPD